jgi:aspartyl-tRNA(Asn)/glutamyl-tRNA(Gln) amidotransferase subunit B
VPVRTIAAWIEGELFGWMKEHGQSISGLRVTPERLSELLVLVGRGELNQNTAKTVLAAMLETGQPASQVVAERGLRQVSDAEVIAGLVRSVLEENPAEVSAYLSGKETLSNWFFGQVMKRAAGQGNPQVIRAELEQQLKAYKSK